MKNLAIIPARGGSKRIPRKNIKNFLGKPIIAYSIITAIESRLFDEVMVSTEDEEIAEIAKTFGASVPFMRSQNNASDYAQTADVLLEVLNNYSSEPYKHACCIYPTAPFITSENLIQAHEKLIRNQYDSVFPVVAFSYPLQRSLHIEEDKIKMVYPEEFNSRSQDLPPRYHDSGQFYWFSIQQFYQNKKLFTDNSSYIILNETEVQDIDTETDWQLAELKYSLLHNTNHDSEFKN